MIWIIFVLRYIYFDCAFCSETFHLKVKILYHTPEVWLFLVTFD